MHTRATSAALKEEPTKENSLPPRNQHAHGKPGFQKRALGDITNLGATGAVNFPAKKPTSTASAHDAATKIRRTVATKAVSGTSSHARRAKAQLAAAVVKEIPMLEQSYASSTRSTSTVNGGGPASPMSTTGLDSTRPPRRAYAKLRALSVANIGLESPASDLETGVEGDSYPYCGAGLPSGVWDIDEEDSGYHLRESRFAVEIHRNLKAREVKFMARSDYMEAQEDITVKMRAILVDWLVDVHLKFKLQPETLFLTVNIIDRFLERQHVLRRKLQLVGVTAMLIACKYEEIYAPVTRDFVYISDKAYTEEEILKMEAIMLNKLGFTLTVPSTLTFLQRALKALDYCDRRRGSSNSERDAAHVSHLSHYCVELAMQDGRMLSYRPSEIAASAILLSTRLVHGHHRYCRTLQYHSGDWDTRHLIGCERELHRVLLAENDPARKLNAIKRKYASARYGEISTLVASLDQVLPATCNSMDVMQE